MWYFLLQFSYKNWIVLVWNFWFCEYTLLTLLIQYIAWNCLEQIKRSRIIHISYFYAIADYFTSHALEFGMYVVLSAAFNLYANGVIFILCTVRSSIIIILRMNLSQIILLRGTSWIWQRHLMESPIQYSFNSKVVVLENMLLHHLSNAF